MLNTEEDRDMWKQLFEDCNKKQGEEIERLRREYKQRSERLALTRESETCREHSSWAIPDGTFDASRVESNDGDATTSHDWSIVNSGPE